MSTEQLTKLASFAGKSANDFWVSTGKKPTDVIAGLASALIEANGRVQALAAENMGLKTFCKNAAFDADYEAELCMERGGFTAALNDIKTPATGAAVAQIEAQGVDKAIVHLTNKFSDTGRIGVPVMALEWLAKELREAK